MSKSPTFKVSITKMELIATCLLCMIVSCATNVQHQADIAADEIVIQQDLRIPMRDGVELATDITIPQAEGKFPVIIVRTPYGKGDGEEGADNARRGYAFVIQDCRGTGNSDGEWEPGIHEKYDGLDTHKWVLDQPWCNGKIATSGASYLGFTQWLVAPDADYSLKAMFTVVPCIDWYKDAGYVGGAFSLGTLMGWGCEMLRPKEGEGAGIDYENFDWDKAYRQLPLKTWDDVIGFEVPFMRHWVEHPEFDDYWKQMSILDRLDEITVPNVTICSWFDIFQKQVFDHVTTVMKTSKSDEARQHQHLIIGPWGHGPNWFVGELEFPENAQIDEGEISEKWFDHWLKGEITGIEEWSPYRIYVMGRNEWRDEQEWPLARTQFTPYYLHSNGSANTLNGDGAMNTAKQEEEPHDNYIYDPDNPVQTIGGNILYGDKMGPMNQIEVEKRDDVLVFSTDTLQKEIEVTGPVKVILYAASDAPDTDWTAKLCDVHPNGDSFKLCEGIVRARYREPDKKPTLIEPGKIYRYEIDLWNTSNVFLPGHQLRVEISSSNFPRFNRNPNTGHKFGSDAILKKANQTIYHDKEHPSHIILPIIPR